MAQKGLPTAKALITAHTWLACIAFAVRAWSVVKYSARAQPESEAFDPELTYAHALALYTAYTSKSIYLACAWWQSDQFVIPLFGIGGNVGNGVSQISFILQQVITAS